jgi:hypothetical protein
MSLTFTNPLLLFSLAAILLPILIHRIVQKKAVSRKFSAVRLLIESQKFTARPYQLKDLLLLMLRILAVVTLVVLAARPVLLKGSPAAYTNAGVRLIILDNSLSMGYRDDSGVRFDLAKSAAREMIQGFGGQVVIIPTVFSKEQGREGHPATWMRPADALSKLETVRLTFGQGDIDSALALANQALRDVKVSRDIVFISDMARADWEGLKAAESLGAVDDVVTLVRVSRPQRDPNLSVKSLRLAEGEAIVATRTRLEVTISNLSDKPASFMTQLHVANTKVDQKPAELKAGEEGKIFLDVFLDKPGWTACEVRLSGDRLTADDTFHFTLRAREKLPVLIVDGDPRTTPRTSESYYLVSALRPAGSESTPFSVRATNDEEFARLDLSEYEVLFLLNVASPQASRLAPFVQSGKPVFIFLGDRVSRDAYNALPFLPVKLREIRSFETKPEHVTHIDAAREPLKSLAAAGHAAGDAAGHAAGPAAGPAGHAGYPGHAGQTGQTGHILSGASFRKYYALEGRAKPLLAFGNGDALLLETDVGAGKLFIFASSADIDWNDLALKASYLPLIQGLLKEARGLPGNSLPNPGTIGANASGTCAPVGTTEVEGPGIYQCSSPAGVLLQGFNPPFGESDLTKLSDSELKKKFGPAQVSIVTYDGSSDRTSGSLAIGRKELWPILLAGLLLLLTAEMILAHLFSRSKTTARREATG